MNETIAIDFRPTDGVVPAIITLFDREGYALHGIRLVPTRDCGRATLQVDLGYRPSTAELRALAARIAAFDGIIDIIHRAERAEALPQPILVA